MHFHASQRGKSLPCHSDAVRNSEVMWFNVFHDFLAANAVLWEASCMNTL